MSAPLRCSIGRFANTECGKSCYFPKEEGIFTLDECQRDISQHLKSVKLSSGVQTKFQAEVKSEGHLIAVRTRLFGDFSFHRSIDQFPSTLRHGQGFITNTDPHYLPGQPPSSYSHSLREKLDAILRDLPPKAKLITAIQHAYVVNYVNENDERGSGLYSNARVKVLMESGIKDQMWTANWVRTDSKTEFKDILKDKVKNLLSRRKAAQEKQRLREALSKM